MIKWQWIAWVAAMQVQRWLQVMLIYCKKTAMQSCNAHVTTKRK